MTPGEHLWDYRFLFELAYTVSLQVNNSRINQHLVTFLKGIKHNGHTVEKHTECQDIAVYDHLWIWNADVPEQMVLLLFFFCFFSIKQKHLTCFHLLGRSTYSMLLNSGRFTLPFQLILLQILSSEGIIGRNKKTTTHPINIIWSRSDILGTWITNCAGNLKSSGD